MLTIDGSFGEGGGQILRSSLALAMVTGRAFRIEKIRAGRKKPGLMRQHLTAVQAAAQISQADVRGADIGSKVVEFHPKQVQPGEYSFSIGTAGSTTLVLQTVLPALLTASGPSRLTFEGGTHNPFAPPFDFLAKAFIPLVNRMGPTVSAELERPGFYPAGGGKFTISIEPARELKGFELTERGEIIRRCGRAVVSNLPGHIAEREINVLRKGTNWGESCYSVENVAHPRGPGNVVIIEVEAENVAEVFTGFGALGRAAEAVATHALQAYQRWLKADVPVGEYLADQIMLPLAIAGRGRYRTTPLTLHSTTHMDLIQKFLDIEVAVDHLDRNRCEVRIG
ncbi:MAG TPA: RNA 3'-terminal phosphate cyclase [Phycisphaerae bacterium]|nr:RNA 3'-terminal phosphate cyclase [Phycisphaerae bacterium]HRR84578.1 RNA 3'-terminal phosphate cyclase [Phycisphaerae bacterium]